MWQTWREGGSDSVGGNLFPEALRAVNPLAQDAVAIQNSLVICSFTANVTFRPATISDYIKWLAAVTGFEYDVTELMMVGERISNLSRAFIVREGITRKDDYLPPRFGENMLAGASAEQRIRKSKMTERSHKGT